MEKFAVSERRACELNHMDRSSYRYQPMPDRHADLRRKLTALAREKPRWGYRRLGVLLEQKGESLERAYEIEAHYTTHVMRGAKAEDDFPDFIARKGRALA